MTDVVMEQIARDLVSVFLPVGLRMLAGLVIGVLVAAMYNSLYRRTNSMHRSGAVGVTAIILCAVAGFLVPLSMGIQPALVQATDAILPEVTRQLEPEIRQQGLNPQAIDGAQISLVLDEIEAELQSQDFGAFMNRQEAEMQAAITDIRQQLGATNTVSLANLLVIVRDAIFARIFGSIRLVTAILIAVPLVFMPTALGIAYMKRRRA
ncbi:MAG: hypothetical protein ACOC4F_00100 [bacterium]